MINLTRGGGSEEQKQRGAAVQSKHITGITAKVLVFRKTEGYRM